MRLEHPPLKPPKFAKEIPPFFVFYPFGCHVAAATVDFGYPLLFPLPRRLLQRELDKCLRLVSSLPMDMEEYFGEFIGSKEEGSKQQKRYRSSPLFGGKNLFNSLPR